MPPRVGEGGRDPSARDIVTEVRDLDARLKKITTEMSRVLAEHGTGLTELDGIGPVVAARLLGRTGHAGRFASASAFANYAGVAPVEVASAQRARHRLPRGGDRQLNLALHVVALTQVRMRASAGRAYYDRKIGEGKTHHEAMRCLKRRLADRAWRTMTADERRDRAYDVTSRGLTDTEEPWALFVAAGQLLTNGDPHAPGPVVKDKVENDHNAAVCHGRVPLVAAQQAIATDWTTAEQHLGLR